MSNTFHPPRPWTTSYAPGVPEDLPVVTGSLFDVVERSAKNYPNAPALEFFGKTITYAEMLDQVERAAEGLRSLGVTAGDPVALILPNCPEHIIAFYAVLRIGAVAIEHNPLYTPRELRKQFEDHNAKAAIVWNKVVASVQDFPDDIAVATLISVDITKSMPLATRAMLRLPIAKARESRDALFAPVHHTVTWETLTTAGRVAETFPRPQTDDLAIIQYTSGTTGTPKGAALTHRNLIANAMQAQAWTPSVTRGDGCVFYAVLPMFHAYGLTLCVTFAMAMGARLVLFPKFDADMVLDVVKKRPATVFPLVPPIAERLLARAQEKGVDLSGIQIGVSGAMPLSVELVQPWEKATGGYLCEGYGLSECSPVLMVNPVADSRKDGTIGLPLPGTEVRIVDPENPRTDVPTGAEGELLVRGPQVFSGYYRKPEETEAVFVDGWFRTGDIVTMDEDGFVRVVDRIKELIITGGFNVAPSEVENVLRQHPGVADVAVIGLPSAHSGEEVAAAIVLEPGALLDTEALRDFGRTILTPYKVPRQFFIVEELPKSMIGKVLRRQVKQTILEQLNS